VTVRKPLGWLGAGRVLAGSAAGFALMAAGMTGLGSSILGGQDPAHGVVGAPAQPELIPGVEIRGSRPFTGGAPAPIQPVSTTARPTPLPQSATATSGAHHVTLRPAADAVAVAGPQVKVVAPAPAAHAASRDTDGDRMPDGWELAYGLNPRLDLDANLDADHDGVSNANEYRLGTNPRVADSARQGTTDGSLDSDGDGVPNAIEQKLGLDPSKAATPPRERDLTRTARNAPTPAPTQDVMEAGVPRPVAAADAKPTDGTLDSDGDGLPNALEVRMGLDPTKAMTRPGVPDGKTDPDGDGLPSALEVVLGLDPTRVDSDGNGTSDGREDSDGDGLSNHLELALGLNPAAVDSDHNGVPDGQEDTDGDGMSNAAELAAGRDPATPDPAPPVLGPAPEPAAPPALADPAPAAPAPEPAAPTPAA
jgi:Bacterial TSP3 repeat